MTEVSYPLWSDNPSTVDLVGFDATSAPVIDAIGRVRSTPSLSVSSGRGAPASPRCSTSSKPSSPIGTTS